MTTDKSIQLNDWLQHASPKQREEFYARAGTSYCAVWQVAAGRRNMSVEKAALVEQATIAIHQVDPSLLPVLRTSTCSVCAECPFATKGGAA